MKNKPTVIDLFCGCGGLSYGFIEAGYDVLLGIDHWKDAIVTFENTHKNAKGLVADLFTETPKDISKKTGIKDVDIIIGGPPCQGFSLAGKNGRTFVDDERNYLFKEFVRFVSVIKPKMFVMENVARMASHDKGETIKEIKRSFEKLGYTVQHRVLQAADYAVPQKRQRVFVVGTKSGNFEYPKALDSQVSVKEAIGDLPKLMSGQESSIANHNAMNHSEQMLKKMSYVKDGGDRKDIPENLRPISGDIRKYIRYNSKLPSVTVTGDMRKVFHYEQNRALTCRELARLQSFPDNFIFEGSSISVQQQIGNAVPPKLGFAVANEVKKVLRK